MRGLRTQENNKFIKFFEIVQEEAKKMGSVFFMDTGDGNDFENASMEGEDLQGWLIPDNRADEFEEIWKESQEDDQWVEFFCWALWSKDNGKIEIVFRDEDNKRIKKGVSHA